MRSQGQLSFIEESRERGGVRNFSCEEKCRVHLSFAREAENRWHFSAVERIAVRQF
jgi:hypothetical protein